MGRIHLKERRGEFDSATAAEVDELSIIGDDCQIKPGAQIINSVLGQGCFVEERARVENSVIWPHTRIGTAAEVSGAIVGRGCHIGRSAVVGPGAVLGDKTSLTDYTITGEQKLDRKGGLSLQCSTNNMEALIKCKHFRVGLSSQIAGQAHLPDHELIKVEY